MNVRQPAVAGMFYAAEAEQLQRDVDTLLRRARPTCAAVPKAMIVPHAGYVFSGPVAAAAYKLLAPARQDIRRIVLFGPAHHARLEGMAVPAADGFATPLGTVRIDKKRVAEIAEYTNVCESDFAHRDEHSLEVQLPFMQSMLDDFELVPIVVGTCQAAIVAEVMDKAWGGPETLLVISSDLSHYLPYDQARLVDKNTCQRILSKVTTLTGHEACGASAINGLMHTQHCRELEVEAIDVRNSGDTAGEKGKVVGYGAFILH